MSLFLRCRPALTRILRKNHYKTLGIDVSSDKKEIKKAYLEKAKKFHPDASEDPNASEIFQKVQEAYETLSDSELKSEYDRHHVKTNRQHGGQSPSSEGETSSGGWNNFDDIYYSGYSARERPRSGEFDPWDHAFRRNQAKRMWEMAMEMEHGDPTYWRQPDHDQFDEHDFFEETRKRFFEDYINEDIFDQPFRDNFYNNSNGEYGNENHQRFHYKDFNNWSSHRSSYENKFNKKYGFNKKNSFSGKSRNFEKEYGQKYWEDEPPVRDQYTSHSYYQDQSMMDDWEAWMSQWEFHQFDNKTGAKNHESRKKSTKNKNKKEKYAKQQSPKDNQKSEKKKTRGKKSKKVNKKDSESNIEQVHAQLNEFGEAIIEMDGAKFILEVQKDGSLTMAKASERETMRDSKKRKKKV